MKTTNIRFAIRAKEDMTIVIDGERTLSLHSLLRRTRARRAVRLFEGHLPETKTPVKIVVRCLRGWEWLIVITNADKAKGALDAYRERWRIE